MNLSTQITKTCVRILDARAVSFIRYTDPARSTELEHSDPSYLHFTTLVELCTSHRQDAAFALASHCWCEQRRRTTNREHSISKSRPDPKKKWKTNSQRGMRHLHVANKYNTCLFCVQCLPHGALAHQRMFGR